MDRRLFLKGLATGSIYLGTAKGLKAFNAKNQLPQQADVLVIGSGPAGLSIADKLTANGINVTVLESGIYRSDSQHQSLADISNKEQLPFDLNFACQRVAGGSSLVWGGYCPRLMPSDFVSGSKYGFATDWPIDFSELEKYYCAAENWLQIGSAESFSRCNDKFTSPYQSSSKEWAKLLKQAEIANPLPASVCVNHQGVYAPLRLLSEYIPRLRNRRNFNLLIDTTALRIAFDKKRNATGVHIRRTDGLEGFIKAKILVLAGGGVQNTRLLQLSANRSFPDGVGNDGGHLGANFMEHPHVRFWIEPAEKWQTLPPSMLHLYNWYEKNKKTGLGSLMVLLNRFEQQPGWRQQQAHGNLLVDVICEQEPQKQNVLTLNKHQKDIFGSPLPRLEYSFSQRDQATLDGVPGAIQDLLELFGGDVNKETGAFGAHLMGTTRMANNAANGVVDKNLRVFGTRNLYVAGSSVFPTGGAANPTLSLTALSLRLGDQILHLAGNNAAAKTGLK